MFFGYLGSYFEGIAVKKLSSVDTTPSASNQHEIGTTAKMRSDFLGEETRKYTVRYAWFGDADEILFDSGTATHYDTRKNQPIRSPEWRLYYQGNAVTDSMSRDDTLFLAKMKDKEHLLFIACKLGSSFESQLFWLFGLDQPGSKFQSMQLGQNSTNLGFASQLILDELGIEVEFENPDYLDSLIAKFGYTFPKTAVLSRYARETCQEVDAIDDPDAAIEVWLAHEEALFKRLELKILRERLIEGFHSDEDIDVEGFIKFSLSVQNRRKSRMGHSFEHQLAALFDANKIRYQKQVVTEHRQKPDFLFPGKDTYVSAEVGDPNICMLAVKSSCKDRWRQILAEAEKIPRKHLATLEPSISESQTNQMQDFGVQLIVPASIATTFSPSQQQWLWTVREFTEFAKSRFGS